MPRQRDDLKAQLNADLTDQLIEIRDRRRWMHEQWLRAHRVWMGQGYENRFHASDTSTATYNIPFVRKAIERTVVRAGKLLTPNGKQYEVRPIGDVSDEKLANVDVFMTFLLNKKIKKKTNINQLVRSLILYNRCHLKTSVMVRNRQVWPTQRVVDPFCFYLYPETAVTIDEADFVFEDFLISYERYKTYVGMGIVEDIAVSDLTAPIWPDHLSQRLSHQGLSEGNPRTLPTTEGKEQHQTPMVSLTEVWLTREDRLHQCYIVHNKKRPGIVSFFPSQYDEPLYRSVVQRSLPNEAFTNSMMDDIVELEGLTNDQLNKFQDAVDWEQGFTFAAAGKRRDSWKAKGRAVWEMEDPREDAVFVQPPVTSTNQLRSWQILLGLVNAMGATGTIAEGQPGRNMPRSGDAVSKLVNLAMADTQDISELIEQEVLTPALGDIYTVCHKFIPDEQLIKIPGGKALSRAAMRKEDFAGDYDFEWVGSLQFQDEQIRAQRMMIFLNMVPQLQPMVQQMGYTFNVVELLQTVWRYGLGERSLQKIVMPIEDLQKTMMAEQIERMMANPQRAQGTQGFQGSSQQNGQQNRSGAMGGLQYNVPSVTDGFIQQ